MRVFLHNDDLSVIERLRRFQDGTAWAIRNLLAVPPEPVAGTPEHLAWQTEIDGIFDEIVGLHLLYPITKAEQEEHGATWE